MRTVVLHGLVHFAKYTCQASTKNIVRLEDFYRRTACNSTTYTVYST